MRQMRNPLQKVLFLICLIFVYERAPARQIAPPFELVVQTGHSSDVNSIAYSPDGSFIVSGSNDSSIILWDAHSGLLLRQLMGHKGPVTDVVVSRDGSAIVSSSHDGTVKLWDTKSGAEIRTFVGHKDRSEERRVGKECRSRWWPY